MIGINSVGSPVQIEIIKQQQKTFVMLQISLNYCALLHNMRIRKEKLNSSPEDVNIRT